MKSEIEYLMSVKEEHESRIAELEAQTSPQASSTPQIHRHVCVSASQ